MKKPVVISIAAGTLLLIAGGTALVTHSLQQKNTDTADAAISLSSQTEQVSDKDDAVIPARRQDEVETETEFVLSSQDFVPGTPYIESDEGVFYSVEVPHVIINQVSAGGENMLIGSDGFIELYNPTETDISLDGWSLQTKGLSDEDAWESCLLEGTIPAHSSYLVLLTQQPETDDASSETESLLSETDLSEDVPTSQSESDSVLSEEESQSDSVLSEEESQSDSLFQLSGCDADLYWDCPLNREGFSVLLMARQETVTEQLVFLNYAPLIPYYVDSLSCSNAVDEVQAVDIDADLRTSEILAESELPSLDLSSCAIRRNRFADTDDNSLNTDTMPADYTFSGTAYVNFLAPHTASMGAWEASDMPLYTVTYNTLGGNTLNGDSYEYYTHPTEPDTPAKYMCIFEGWFTDEACTQAFDFQSLPTEDLTLYAGWSINPNAEVVNRYNELRATINIYINSYYTEESVDHLLAVQAIFDATDLEHVSREELEAQYTDLENAINGLVYKTGTVPRFYITTEDHSGNVLAKSTGYVNSTIAFVTSDGAVLEEADTARIKVRGNTTSEGLKKPYNIKFSEKQNLLGMGAAKKWCLLAEWFDPSMLRNYIAMDFAKELGLAYTSDKQFVEVWLDGDYRGVYLLTEPVEDGSSRVDLQKSNGDFLIMYEKERVDPTASYVVTNKGYRFEIKEPQTPDAGQIANITAILNGIDAALDSGDYSQIQQYIDTESFAKYYLLQDFYKNSDACYSSVYFYYKGGKLYAGPVWDFDMAMGNSVNESLASTENFQMLFSCWFNDLFFYEEFQMQVQNQYNAHRGYLASVYASGGLIDSLESQYSSLFEKNFTDTIYELSLTSSGLNRIADSSYSANVEYLRSWLAARDAWYGNAMDTLVYSVYVTDVINDDDGITITWKPASNATAYQVVRENEAGSWDILCTTTDLTYTDTTAKKKTSYRYSVRAVNGSLYSYTFMGSLPEVTRN